MWQRKLASAYWASVIMVLYFALNSVGHLSGTVRIIDQFASTAVIVSFYIVPAMFVYGFAVSMLTEYAIGKTVLSARWKILSIGLLHAAFGFAFTALLFQYLPAGWFGGAGAVLFFVIDNMLARSNALRLPKLRLAILSAPVAAVAVLTIWFYAVTPPLPPFTANDAVQFATSGKGTITDLFPKQVGTSRTTIEGYEVERETSVAPVGKEEYEVAFTERWTKDGKTGQNKMVYLVKRGSLSANGGGGDEPPYRR